MKIIIFLFVIVLFIIAIMLYNLDNYQNCTSKTIQLANISSAFYQNKARQALNYNIKNFIDDNILDKLILYENIKLNSSFADNLFYEIGVNNYLNIDHFEDFKRQIYHTKSLTDNVEEWTLSDRNVFAFYSDIITDKHKSIGKVYLVFLVKNVNSIERLCLRHLPIVFTFQSKIYQFFGDKKNVQFFYLPLTLLLIVAFVVLSLWIYKRIKQNSRFSEVRKDILISISIIIFFLIIISIIIYLFTGEKGEEDENANVDKKNPQGWYHTKLLEKARGLTNNKQYKLAEDYLIDVEDYFNESKSEDIELLRERIDEYKKEKF